MAEIINLRMVRKAKKRVQAEEQSAANRAKFGQTKGEVLKRRREEERQARDLDGDKREPD
jgi:hypothetical protein